MNTPKTLVNSQTVDQTHSKPPLEENEIPTVILDASFFRRRAPEGDAQQTKSTRTLTYSSR